MLVDGLRLRRTFRQPPHPCAKRGRQLHPRKSGNRGRTTITGEQVAAVMNRIDAVRGAPKSIHVDNGPEFVSRALDQWAYMHQVTLDFSRPGKPTDNALVESFNGRLRDECLNTNWFISLDDAKRKIEAWREQYNESRPHTALGYVTYDW